MASFTDRWSSGPPYRDIDPRNWDEFELDIEAEGILSRAEIHLRNSFLEVAPQQPLTVDRMVRIHGHMFEGVFPDFAGMLRGEGEGRFPVDIHFDQYAGVAFGEIDAALADLDRLLSELDDDLLHRQSRSSRRNAVIRTASIVHCEIVRIHPFINGNGRTARMCISYILARAGYPPVPFEVDRSAYYAANSRWLDHQDIESFQRLLSSALSI